MTFDMRNRVLVEAVARYEAGQLSRRQLLRTLGSLGLGAVGALAFGTAVRAESGDEHAVHAIQDSGTPPAIPAPEVGPRDDGTTLWKVLVGSMDMEQKLDFQGFFPGELTITAGDSIWFDYGMGGFHTVTFLGGGDMIPLIVPDPEAGTPTAGPPQMMINPQALLPSGGDVVDGTAFVNSGADVFLGGAPVVFTFPTAGTFEYLCVPHSPVMKATIIVQEAGSAPPLDQAGVDALAAEQIEALREEGLAEKAKYTEAVSTVRDDGTTLWEVAVGAGPNQARVMAFLPEAIEVAVGDTIKYTIRSLEEPHTVSFIGAGEAPPEDLIPGAFADGSPKFLINNQTLYAQGGNVWSGTGWVNSGYMGISAAGLPMEWEVTFDTEGEYIYYCILHGDAQGNGMAATVTVTPKA